MSQIGKCWHMGDLNQQLWVFCCGMIRSGSTLQYQLAAGLVEVCGTGRRSRYVSENRFAELLTEYKEISGLIVVKAHLLTPAMEDLLIDRRALSIGCYRDIRDVAVSIMRKWNVTFEELVANRWLDRAIEMLESWSLHPRHLLSKYEDVRDNPAREVLRIASHLSIDCSDRLAVDLADAFSIEQQRRRVQIIAEKKASLNIEGDYWDKESLLHHNHLFSGGSGDWKNMLTQQQVKILESRHRDWLLAKGYCLSSPE